MQNSNTFLKLVKSKFKFRFFLLLKLPAAYFSGLRVTEMSVKEASVSIRHKWLTQNPFKSIYFASLSMAAELSTGVLALNAVWGIEPKVSLLVLNMSADFKKKATGKIIFTCSEGEKISNAVRESIDTGEARTVKVKTIGLNKELEEVAEFYFTWTFMQKTKK